MTPNEANLFYGLGYLLAAAVVLVCLWRKNSFDPRHIISRKTFAKRVLWMVIIAILGEALLAGSYFIFTGPRQFYFFTAVMLLMSVAEYVLLASSFFQRYAVYPRGRALALVLLALFVLCDLFMPFGTKFGIAIGGILGGFLLPDHWDAWTNKNNKGV